jgi:hypothetical protein
VQGRIIIFSQQNESVPECGGQPEVRALTRLRTMDSRSQIMHTANNSCILVVDL